MSSKRHILLTRKHFLQVVGLLSSEAILSGCSKEKLEMGSFFNFTKGDKVSDIEIPDKKSAKDFILSELSKRYDEDFIQVDGTEMTAYDPDEDREICYEMLVAPKTQLSKVFTSMVYTNADTNKQVFPVMDNYQQYLFTPIVCKPFEEYFAHCEGVDGYSASLFYNKMDSKVWTADQVEQYMGFGMDGDPEVSVFALLSKDSTENLAHLIYKAHIDLAKLKRSMQINFALTGSDIRRPNNIIYCTHVGYEVFVTRRSAQISYESVLDEVSSKIKKVTDDGWDGIGTVGDPDSVITSITWKQQDKL
ncbi:hypothetical protein [Lancefieldella rimae]|uniref:hypothetical protein n=1 Tax=Lancefieldella rimae TaxID=1383 RepID=UPI0028E4DBA1|nr:hypothetical protein [Lancefieldella rimae]